MVLISINIDEVYKLRRRFALWLADYRIGRTLLHIYCLLVGKIKDVHKHIRGILREWK